ncbi:MAG: hypothetical protein PHI18_04810 [bacterium]|nr:hypothetical protein [bacterium]
MSLKQTLNPCPKELHAVAAKNKRAKDALKELMTLTPYYYGDNIHWNSLSGNGGGGHALKNIPAGSWSLLGGREEQTAVCIYSAGGLRSTLTRPYKGKLPFASTKAR